MSSLYINVLDDRKDQKCFIRELLLQRSPRINLYHNSSGYSSVWKRFWLVQLDGADLDVAVCSNCFGILTYRSKDGTSGLKKHSCHKNSGEEIPDLAERMPAPDLTMLLDKAKQPPRKLTKTTRDLIMGQPSCSDYSNKLEEEYFPAYHVDNDAEEDMGVNQPEEELNTSANDGLNGPYLLKKETHCSTILDQLLRDDTYTDVTLTAEGQNIRAHKVVLSLSSGYFREVLDRDVNARNVVFFKDLKFYHLKNIINFIYTGEATIDAGELENFMSTAQMLDISSLADGYKNLPKCVLKNPTRSGKRSAPSTSSPRKSQKMKVPSISHINEEMEVNEAPEIKTEPDDIPVEDNSRCDNEVKDVDIDIDSKTDITDFQYTEKYPNDEHQYRESIENNEKEVTLPAPGRCPYCVYKLLENKPPADMMLHLAMNHRSKYAFRCEFCNRYFIKRKLLISHKRNCSRPLHNPQV